MKTSTRSTPSPYFYCYSVRSLAEAPGDPSSFEGLVICTNDATASRSKKTPCWIESTRLGLLDVKAHDM